MRKKRNVTREQVLQKLMELAAYPVNDGVKLAYLSQEEAGEIGGLDLTGLTEFKRNSNGTVELKFADRTKALESLLDRLKEEETAGAEAFLRALSEPEAPGPPGQRP